MMCHTLMDLPCIVVLLFLFSTYFEIQKTKLYLDSHFQKKDLSIADLPPL